jgi:type III restriction enzyme
MKLKFDPHQDYQQQAVAAVINIFAGQQRVTAALDSTAASGGLFAGLGGVGNVLSLAPEQMLANVQGVQEARKLPRSDGIDRKDFSVEMETGTGKTYVYLRTTLELNRAYGFTKFIVVVPTVAIREGVTKTIGITREHFSALYSGQQYETRTFSSARLSDVRLFAASNAIQILVLNIDAFNKAGNVIRRPHEAMGGLAPIDLLAKCRPIVILDEPQNMEGDSARVALQSLNPLCTLRYSATHRNVEHLVHRLSPVDAYELGLVKKIEVLSVLPERDPSVVHVVLMSIDSKRKGIVAEIEIDVKRGDSTARRTLKIERTGVDLFGLSGGLHAYTGLVVESMNAAQGEIELSNGTVVSLRDKPLNNNAVMKSQIEETVREHLEKELAIARFFPAGRRLKVLSLFFIDRVVNYVTSEGKIRKWFEDAYSKFKGLPRYRELKLPSVDSVHGGYFSRVKGVVKDTRGDSEADNDTYALIMRDKERLLSLSEPLRFIFSHSALREGWDNPNVFQICTLNETRSELKKRQEIGRGMRLPVDERGIRIPERAIAFLTIVANESYDEFARNLQREIEDETGTTFEGRIANRRMRRPVDLVPGWRRNDDFLKLWDSATRRTVLTCSIDVEKLVTMAAEGLKNSPAISPPHVVASRVQLEVSRTGVSSKVVAERTAAMRPVVSALPNPLTALQAQTGLSRATLVRILTQSERMSDFAVNTDVFLGQATVAIEAALTQCMVEGVDYTPTGETTPLAQFEERVSEAYEDRLLPVSKSITTHIEYDSETERRFASTLDTREDIKLFVKLPRWFVVPTPAGDYTPDWGVVKLDKGVTRVYLVRETKSVWNVFELRAAEKAKIDCARKHFAAIHADFGVVTDAGEV